MKHTTSHARKWHRTSPCPYCGTRKPGIEDLRKALWYANDAVIHGTPIYADTNLSGLGNALFSALVNVDWAGLRCVWWAFANSGTEREILTALKNKIVKIEKDGE